MINLPAATITEAMPHHREWLDEDNNSCLIPGAVQRDLPYQARPADNFRSPFEGSYRVEKSSVFGKTGQQCRDGIV